MSDLIHRKNAGPLSEVPAFVRLPVLGLAIAGGCLLLLSTALTIASIAGRALVWLDLAPVPGDVELVQMSVGLAVFAFLPYCQLVRGHVTVDIIVNALGKRAKILSNGLGDIFLLVAMIVLAWRLYAGLLDRLAYHETTFILRLPLWWFYVPAFVCLSVAALTAGYTAYRNFAVLRAVP